MTLMHHDAGCSIRHACLSVLHVCRSLCVVQVVVPLKVMSHPQQLSLALQLTRGFEIKSK